MLICSAGRYSLLGRPRARRDRPAASWPRTRSSRPWSGATRVRCLGLLGCRLLDAHEAGDGAGVTVWRPDTDVDGHVDLAILVVAAEVRPGVVLAMELTASRAAVR